MSSPLSSQLFSCSLFFSQDEALESPSRGVVSEFSHVTVFCRVKICQRPCLMWVSSYEAGRSSLQPWRSERSCLTPLHTVVEKPHTYYCGHVQTEKSWKNCVADPTPFSRGPVLIHLLPPRALTCWPPMILHQIPDIAFHGLNISARISVDKSSLKMCRDSTVAPKNVNNNP